MINGKKVVVVMPAHNAERTLLETYRGLPHDVVDEVVVVDDASRDSTVSEARRLGLEVIEHARNMGYGGNQKTCYRAALEHGADIIVMVHPDYQYDPRLVTVMAAMIGSDVYDVALGSRILGNSAIKGGMPVYKYVANRLLTAFENICLGVKLSEFHTGYRAFSRRVLENLPINNNSDDFIFDNEMLAQAVAFNFRIGEISCPTRYAVDSSSISLRRSIRYGAGVVYISIRFLLWRCFGLQWKLVNGDGRNRLSCSPR